jgi:ubiquitin-protein ligase
MVEKKPVAGVKFVPGKEDNPLEWKFLIDGPANYTVNGASRKCPYGGRVFEVTVKFPNNYPFKHPDMTFKPGQLYHPNINAETGEICADTITKSFGPTKNVTDLAKLVVAFMETPNTESPLDADCTTELLSAIEVYEEKARKMAEKAPKSSS